MNTNQKHGSDWEMPALAKAKELARKSVKTLQQLQERYPEDLPPDIVERVQQECSTDQATWPYAS
jgi:hypothetical protein